MALDLNPYQSARRQIRYNTNQQLNTNAYARTISQQRGNRQLSDYRRDWTRSVPQYGASYAQRGLAGPGVRSGVYQKAYNQFLGDYARSLGRMQTDYGTEMNQFKTNQANIIAQREQALADVQAAKARNISLAGLYLKNLRPLYGG